MAWRPNYPIAETKLSSVAGLIRENFQAIDEATKYEHYGPDAGSTQGLHKDGLVGSIFIGTTDEINNLSNPPSGAIAFDTTVGYLKRFIGTGWTSITSLHSRVRAYLSDDVACASGATQSASGDWVIFDTKSYDQLDEYNASTGIFTAKEDGTYLILVHVAIGGGGGTPINTAAASAVANTAVTWTVSGAPTNYQAIDEYPTSNDYDIVFTGITDAEDRYRSSLRTLNPVPLGATNISATVTFRAKGIGCSCNSSCYDQNCVCYNRCYVQSCPCFGGCYLFVECPCDASCYNENYKNGIPCSCYGPTYYLCYLCYQSAYGTVSCQTCYNSCYLEGECSCNGRCYLELETKVKPSITLDKDGNPITYYGSNTTLTKSFANYEYTWLVNPETSLPWTRVEANDIGHFGIQAVNDGGITTGCSAVVSQVYLTLSWYPSLPVYILRLFKNNVEVEKVFQPIYTTTSTSAQAIRLHTLVNLNKNDTLRVSVVAVRDYAESIIGDPTGSYTFFTVHRVVSQCVW